MLSARWLNLFRAWARIAPQPQQLSKAEGGPRSCPSRLLPYGVALVVTVALLLVHYEFNHRLTDNVLPLMLGLAVLVSALRIEYLHRARRYAEAEAAAHQRVQDDSRALNQTLQQRLHQFETLLNVIPIGIAVADDPACQRLWLNPAGANLLRLPPGAHTSLSALSGEQPTTVRYYREGREIAPEELPLHYAVTHGVEVQNAEFEAVCADGHVLHLWGHAAPLFDAAGQVRGGIAAFLDITERTQAERALLQAYAELAQRVQAPTAIRSRKIA